jgi:tRNA-specific 2-thiouridylase
MSSKGSVLVAMSGGVDSSVAACLLLEQGYEVVGSHMQLVHLEGVEHGCCGPAARTDAAEVARIAGFPFEICDLTLEFDQRVIDDFVAEHEAGRTPNPCARCNGEIKFGAFLRRADELGIDRVATGHYVRTELGAGGSWRLLRGADRSKDQSYMLHMLGQRQLSRSLFPIGGLAKAETRALAERFGLPVASKPDSQELCFAPSGDAGGFLGEVAPHLMREGEVVDPEGRVLAYHGGAAAFTVGQRRGLGVSGPAASYVLEVDAAANRVVVGPGELLARRGLIADRISWIAGVPPSVGPFEAGVKIRYRGEDVPSVIGTEGNRVRVEFRTPQRGVAPGQSVVIYRGDELLGGARILEPLRWLRRRPSGA